MDSYELKGFADDNFKFDENDRKLSKPVENTGKRRNCSLLAISPFPSVFKRLVYQGRQKVSLCGNGLTLYQTTTKLDMTKLKRFEDHKVKFAKMNISVFDRLENIQGKGQNAGY